MSRLCYLNFDFLSQLIINDDVGDHIKMSMKNYDITDPTFVQDLQASQGVVWQAAKYIGSLGYTVTVRGTNVRPSPEEAPSYSDMGDIEIIQRIEVKKRIDIDFRSVDDFPYDSIIVDVAHTWDNAKQKPYAYMIYNSSLTGFILVKGSTFKHWIKVQKYDRQKKRKRIFYECPLQYCSYKTHLDDTF